MHLSRKIACAKGEETGVELSVNGGFLQRGVCEVQQRYSDTRVRQLLTDLKKCLVSFLARRKANGDDGDIGHLMIFYVPKHHVLLNVLDKLGKDDVARARRGAVMNEKAAAADGSDHAVRKKKGCPANDAILSTCEMKIRFFLLTGLPSFLGLSCTQTGLTKLVQAVPELSVFLLIARR